MDRFMTEPLSMDPVNLKLSAIHNDTQSILRKISMLELCNQTNENEISEKDTTIKMLAFENVELKEKIKKLKSKPKPLTKKGVVKYRNITQF